MTSRAPPESRKDIFVKTLIRLSKDSRYGYSQKPPSGRWGPDFDCSSIIYYAANCAGYSVGTGGDKVRFTGTMLKDFEKAGFQILPFANVGISDLKIGDILLNLALHAEVYIGEGQTVAATSSEDGRYSGKQGDQTGHEIEIHPVETFTGSWDYVLRPPDDSDDTEEDVEEGDIMPINYGPTPMTQTQPWGQNGMPYNGYPQGNMQGMNYPQGGMQSMGYPQGNMMGRGYPQGGNLGQMNGYSQANAGGYPQGQQMPTANAQQNPSLDCCFVKGIEGARNTYNAPNTKKPIFDEDKSIFYWVTYGPQGTPIDIHPYQFGDNFESMEDMPQHLSPLMQGYGQMNQPAMHEQEPPITREELKQMIKEMMNNESTSQPTANSGQQRNSSNGPRNGNSRSNQ